MEYLIFEDYILGRYNIDIKLENSKTYLVYSKDKEYVKRFIKSISGINRHSGKCLFNNNDIYDNDEYFSKRLFIDFNKQYVRTLNIKTIKESFNIFPFTKFNEDVFKKCINEVDLRKEVLIKDEYKFSSLGINLCAYCLIKSLNYENLIVLNPFYNSKNNNINEAIIKELTNKEKYNTVIIENNNLDYLSKYVDSIIILTDYNNAIVINNKDTFLICDDNIYLRNKIFRNDHIIISLNDYTKDELKNLSKCRIKYKIITYKDLITLLGDKYD